MLPPVDKKQFLTPIAILAICTSLMNQGTLCMFTALSSSRFKSFLEEEGCNHFRVHSHDDDMISHAILLLTDDLNNHAQLKSIETDRGGRWMGFACSFVGVFCQSRSKSLILLAHIFVQCLNALLPPKTVLDEGVRLKRG